MSAQTASLTCLTHAVTLRLSLDDATVTTELARGFARAHAHCDLSVERTLRLPGPRSGAAERAPVVCEQAG